jgi:hypothetical protein
MVLGSLGFMFIEGLSLADAFYFSIVTIATVGYGDIHPATQTGKILAIILIITGVGTFLGVIANATDMLLNKREQRIRLEKLNMVIGIFFSEIGTKLLTYLSNADPNVDTLRKDLIVRSNSTDQDFLSVGKCLSKYHYHVDIKKIDLEDLCSFLEQNGNLLMRILENPNLLEHESFTDLLRAVLHLKEELTSRDNLRQLPDTDYAHLAGDAKRAYALLGNQWLDYMKYLKNNYPYLFSLAMRTNPFDREASPIVK